MPPLQKQIITTILHGHMSVFLSFFTQNNAKKDVIREKFAFFERWENISENIILLHFVHQVMMQKIHTFCKNYCILAFQQFAVLACITGVLDWNHASIQSSGSIWQYRQPDSHINLYLIATYCLDLQIFLNNCVAVYIL